MSRARADVETQYVQGEAIPWIPFRPLSEAVLLRYHRIDPLRGEIVCSARVPHGCGQAPLYQTGPLIAHTIRGAWRYREHDWVSRAGDTVSVPAGSIHTAETVGDEEAVIFLVVTGELLVFDEDGSLVWEESWRTALERYAEHCRKHRLRQLDLTGVAALW